MGIAKQDRTTPFLFFSAVAAAGNWHHGNNPLVGTTRGGIEEARPSGGQSGSNPFSVQIYTLHNSIEASFDFIK